MKKITGHAGYVGSLTIWTCATKFYQAGLDEQNIVRRTGNRFELAVRMYKRTNAVLQESV